MTLIIVHDMYNEEKAPRLPLQKDLLEMEIGSDNGSVLSIHDRRVNKQYVQERKFARLFRLMLPSPTWDGQHVDS